MKTWLYFLTAGSAVCLVVYLLYCRGIAVTKRITAVLFVFRTGKNGDRASLNSCTGWVRRVGRFRASGIYTFTLDCQLSKGDAAVSLLDKDKRELLRLDRISAGGDQVVEAVAAAAGITIPADDRGVLRRWFDRRMVQWQNIR